MSLGAEHPSPGNPRELKEKKDQNLRHDGVQSISNHLQHIGTTKLNLDPGIDEGTGGIAG